MLPITEILIHFFNATFEGISGENYGRLFKVSSNTNKRFREISPSMFEVLLKYQLDEEKGKRNLIVVEGRGSRSYYKIGEAELPEGHFKSALLIKRLWEMLDKKKHNPEVGKVDSIQPKKLYKRV